MMFITLQFQADFFLPMFLQIFKWVKFQHVLPQPVSLNEPTLCFIKVV